MDGDRPKIVHPVDAYGRRRRITALVADPRHNYDVVKLKWGRSAIEPFAVANAETALQRAQPVGVAVTACRDESGVRQ